MGSTAFATNTRVLTMGDNNEILLDEANIWLYPSRVFDYPDIAIADFVGYDAGFGTKDGAQFDGDDFYFHEFGVHWKFGEEKPWVLGTYFFNSEGQFGDEAYLSALMLPVGLKRGLDYAGTIFPSGNWGVVPDLDFTPDDYTNRRLALFYGRPLGTHKFGFSFQYLHSSQNLELDAGGTLQTTMERSFTRYNFGVGLTEGGGLWDVSAMIQMLTWTDKDWDGTALVDETKPSGNMMVDLNGRYFWSSGGPITWVPHAKFMFGKFESEDFDNDVGVGPDIYKYNVLHAQLGWGMHYQPAANMLAVLDFGAAYTKWDSEEDNTSFDGSTSTVFEDNLKIITLPYFRMGFEGQVFSWMDVRFGATSYWRDMEIEEIDDGTTDEIYSENFPDNMTYLGFSFNFGNLTIDTFSDPELFLEGFNFISGGDQDMNAGISAIYSF
jgi:hypothetical protein